MQRLDRLSDGIANLGELVRAEFNRDRDMRFRVALQTARDVFESTQAARDRAVTQRAVDGLYEARENFIFDLRQAINESKPLLAQQHFIRALYAETSRIRCYMAMDDPETARKRLLETMPVFHDEATKLIRLWFGPYPAAFFHKAVAPEVLDRFLQLQRWLQGDDPFTQKDDARVMFAIINDMRGDFWNPRVIENEYYDRVNQLLNRPQRTFQDRISNLTEALTSAEIIMENMQRLLGFELEIRSMRLMKQSFDDWSHLISEADLQQHGGGIIVDKEIIEHLRRQQATRRVQ